MAVLLLLWFFFLLFLTNLLTPAVAASSPPLPLLDSRTISVFFFFFREIAVSGGNCNLCWRRWQIVATFRVDDGLGTRKRHKKGMPEQQDCQVAGMFRSDIFQLKCTKSPLLQCNSRLLSNLSSFTVGSRLGQVTFKGQS